MSLKSTRSDGSSINFRETLLKDFRFDDVEGVVEVVIDRSRSTLPVGVL